jgi:hypothetical protein
LPFKEMPAIIVSMTSVGVGKKSELNIKTKNSFLLSRYILGFKKVAVSASDCSTTARTIFLVRYYSEVVWRGRSAATISHSSLIFSSTNNTVGGHTSLQPCICFKVPLGYAVRTGFEPILCVDMVYATRL